MPYVLGGLQTVLIFLRSFLRWAYAAFRFICGGKNVGEKDAIAFLVGPEVARLVNIKRVTALINYVCC